MGLPGDPTSADTLTALKYQGVCPGDMVGALEVTGSAQMRLCAIVVSPAIGHTHTFTCGNSIKAKKTGDGRCILPLKPEELTKLDCVLAECDHTAVLCRCGRELVEVTHPTNPQVVMLNCEVCNAVDGVANQQCTTCHRWRKIMGVKLVQQRNADSVWVGPHNKAVTLLTGSNNNMQYARNIKGGYYITMYITANKQEEKNFIAQALKGAYTVMDRAKQAETLAKMQQEKGLPFKQPPTGFILGLQMQNGAWRKGTSKVDVGANKAAFLTLGEPVYRRSHPMATLSFGSVMAYLKGHMLTSCLGPFRTRSVPFVLDYAYRHTDHEPLCLYEYRALGETVRSHHKPREDQDEGPPPQEEDDEDAEEDQGDSTSDSESEVDLDMTVGPVPVWREETPEEDVLEPDTESSSDGDAPAAGQLVVYRRGNAESKASEDIRPAKKPAKPKKTVFDFEAGHPRCLTYHFRIFQQPHIVRVLAPRMPSETVLDQNSDEPSMPEKARAELRSKQCLFAKLALTFTVPWRRTVDFFPRDTFPELEGMPADDSADWCIAWKLACTQGRITVVGAEWLRCQQEGHVEDFFNTTGFQEPASDEGDASDEAFRVCSYVELCS